MFFTGRSRAAAAQHAHAAMTAVVSSRAKLIFMYDVNAGDEDEHKAHNNLPKLRIFFEITSGNAQEKRPRKALIPDCAQNGVFFRDIIYYLRKMLVISYFWHIFVAVIADLVIFCYKKVRNLC